MRKYFVTSFAFFSASNYSNSFCSCFFFFFCYFISSASVVKRRSWNLSKNLSFKSSCFSVSFSFPSNRLFNWNPYVASCSITFVFYHILLHFFFYFNFFLD